MPAQRDDTAADRSFPDTDWIDAAPIAAVVVRAGTGDVLFANVAARLIAERNGGDTCLRAIATAVQGAHAEGNRTAEVDLLPAVYHLRIAPDRSGEHLIVWCESNTALAALSPRLLSFLAAHSADQVVVTDARGRIEWVNAGFEKLTGYSLAECLGMVPGKLLQGPDTDATAIEFMRRRLERGEGFRGLEILNYSRHGCPMWLRIDVEPIFDDDGTRTHFVGFQTDITEQRAAALRIERLVEQLDVAQEFGRFGVWERAVGPGDEDSDDAMCRILGAAPGDVGSESQVAAPTIAPDECERLKEAWRASFARGGPGEARYRTRSSDGTVRVVHSAWRIKRDAARQACVAIGVTIDDTQAYTLARGLGELTHRFDLVADLTGVGIWRYEAASGLIFWDERIFRMLGFAPHANGIPVEQVRALAHPDDVDDIERATRAAMVGDALVDTQTRYRRADGVERVLMTRRVAQRDTDGQVIGLLGVSLDVTDRVSAEERWRFALEGSGDGVWDWNVPSGQVFHSDRYLAVLGYRRGTFGESIDAWRAHVHPEDVAAAADAANACAAGRTELYVSEHRLRCADGSWKWVLERGKPIERDGAGHATRVIGTLVDLTERKLAEARWRYALEGAGDALWEWDGITDKVFYSDRFQTLLGYRPGELSDALDEWERRVHPDEFPAVNRAADQHIAGETEQYVAEYRMRCKDGRWKWVLDRGKVVARDGAGRALRMIGTIVDLTERKQAEHALRAAQERIAMATRAVGIGIWERDLITQHSVWDAQMYALRGLTPDDPRPPEELRVLLVHPDDRPRMQALMDEAIASGGIYACEFRVIWPDASTHWIASRAQLLGDGAGAYTRVLGVNWDITDAKSAEAALRDKEAAEHANLAKSEFLSRMSHELRTPLNAILGFTQLLQSDDAVALTASQRDRLEHIHAASWHLLALINDVLDLTRIEAGGLRMAREPVDLAAVVGEAVRMVDSQARPRMVTIDDRVAAGQAVWGDSTRLKQVLLNLLSNAVKYNQHGGQVTIASRVEGAHTIISVRDTGLGIAADRLPHLFEPFNRLGAERGDIEGTGIGAAIALKLVEQMGGCLGVSSTRGVGSEFSITLDTALIANVGNPASGTTSGETATARTASARVVYIEDNPINTMLVEELLGQRPGIVFEAAVDGKSGVELVERVLPDLVLIDMQLPDFDGDEVFRRLRANPKTAGIPCVALSANAMASDIAAARALGFFDYLTKPIDINKFLARIDGFLDH